MRQVIDNLDSNKPTLTSCIQISDSDSDCSEENDIFLKILSPTVGVISLFLNRAEFPTMAVRDLKERLEPKLGWPKEKIVLSFLGKPLSDTSTLQSLNLTNGCRLFASRDLKDMVSDNYKNPIIADESLTPNSTASNNVSNNLAPSSPLHCFEDFHSNLINNTLSVPPNSNSAANFSKLSIYSNILRSLSYNQPSSLQNPELSKKMLSRGSKISKLLEKNQDLLRLLNEPDISDTLRNPNLLREVMKNNDRQLSSIEALPGGLNILSNLYQSLQEYTNLESFDKSTDSLNYEFAVKLDVKKRTPNAVNCEPFPNPWNLSPGASSPKNNNFNNLLVFSNDALNLSKSLLPSSDSNLDSYIDPSSNSASSFLSKVFQMSADLLDSTPKSNTSLPPTISPPSYNSMPSILPPSSPTTNETSVANRKPSNADLSLLNHIHPMTFSSSSQLPTSSSSLPTSSSSSLSTAAAAAAEERYAPELRLLMEMGFSKKEDCISALLASNGSIEKALDYLNCNISPPPEKGKN